MKIYRMSIVYGKPSETWFSEGAIFGYTRSDTFRSRSVKLDAKTAATWGNKNGITHEMVFGLMQHEFPAWTWIYDIANRKLQGYGDLPEDIKQAAMEEVNKRL